MDDQLLDTNELARILNFTRTSIYRMIKRGDIKAIRIGQFWRVSRRELERLLSEAEARASSPGSRAPLKSAGRQKRKDNEH